MAPTINPDFSEESGLAPGIYPAKIIGVEQKVGKESGAPYLNWKLEVEGLWIYHSTPFSGRGAGLFKQLVHATVSPGYDGGPINTDMMVGKSLQVKLEKGLNRDGSESKYMRVMEVKALEDSFDSFEP